MPRCAASTKKLDPSDSTHVAQGPSTGTPGDGAEPQPDIRGKSLLSLYECSSGLASSP